MSFGKKFLTLLSVIALLLCGHAYSETKITIDMSPTPSFKTQNGEFSFRVFGKLQTDYVFFDDDKSDYPTDADLRRARFGFSGNVAKDWAYTAEFDLAGSTASANNVSLTYTGFKNVALRIGHFTPAFILEEATDDANILFMERSSGAGAFATGEIFGVAIHTGGEKWTFNTGIHGDKANSDANTTDDEQWSSITRATFAPIKTEDRLLHLGIGLSYRNPKSDSVAFASPAENSIQTTASVATGTLTDVDDYFVYSAELAGLLGSLSLQAEYMLADLSRDSQDTSFSAWYGQASYFLTGESRNYSGGQFHAVNPGDSAAFELTLRYSNLDLNDDFVRGGEMKNLTLGLNWYPNKNLKFILNYIAIDTDEYSVVSDDSPSALLMRAQVTF